jgi:hypothetical protein
MAFAYQISKLLGMNVKDFNLLKGLVTLLVVPIAALVGIVYYLDVGPDPLRQLGAAVSVVIVYKVIRESIKYIRRRSKHREPRSYGKWAIVTGCTGGVGQAFAHGLAARGMDILLVSRNSEKLDAEAKAIQAKYPTVQCKILAYDFTDHAKAPEFYKSLQKMMVDDLKGDVGVLVNNVGVGNESPIYAIELDPELESDMIRINCEGTCRMTRAVLPLLVGKKRGAIINISSGWLVVVFSTLFAV